MPAPSTTPWARSLALHAVKRTVGTLDRLWPHAEGVVVLLYHRVGARTGGQVDLPTSLFDDQLAWLSASGRAASLDDALDVLTGPPRESPPPIVVTFDDGTADFAEVALPVAERHGVPLTVYVASDFIEQGRPFPNDGRPVSWAALVDAVATGLVTVGSHTHTHALLDRAPAETAQDEVERSVGLIEERLGRRAEHFAYPKALPGSPAAEAVVRRRFRSAALAGSRPNVPGRTDVHRLARSPIQVGDGMRWFQRKAGGGMALEDSLRRVLNRRRYSGAVT